jgi:hypothetical protein
MFNVLRRVACRQPIASTLIGVGLNAATSFDSIDAILGDMRGTSVWAKMQLS